ncbi:MAG: ComF family protein [Burkholderiales bacterium]|nr:ComF family protein [Burkholderiales bacterium]
MNLLGMSIFRVMSSSSPFGSVLSQDCTLCGVRSHASLCDACHRDLPFRQALGCPRCNAISTDHQVCGACLSDPPHFDDTISAFRYAFPLDRLVQAYKFNANLGLLSLFADALASAIRANTADVKADLVIPLPLAPKRLAERGFNQSALLGANIAKALGIRFEARGMLRVRETPPQTGLNREARLKNVRGAFDCARRLEGRHVAVVDDVMTTGATLSEAAKVLKKAGAARVSAWVVARATKDERDVAVGNDLETVPFHNIQR